MQNFVKSQATMTLEKLSVQPLLRVAKCVTSTPSLTNPERKTVLVGFVMPIACLVGMKGVN